MTPRRRILLVRLSAMGDVLSTLPGYRLLRQALPDSAVGWVVEEPFRPLLEGLPGLDAIVVVGGAHSANTVRLVKLARTLKPTFHIQTEAQLDPAQFASFTAVGVTAGASTPSFIIEEVRKALESI